jgi:hypothetical protein
MPFPSLPILAVASVGGGGDPTPPRSVVADKGRDGWLGCDAGA